MISSLADLPAGLTGFGVRGTVLAQDVSGALRLVAPKGRLFVSVDPEFDGYMSELVHGLAGACNGEMLLRCALVVPDGMLAEARVHGEGSSLRIFALSERVAALDWLSAAATA
jgi:hypothetical protein